MNYIGTTTATVSGVVKYYDLDAGIAYRILLTYNFIVDGGYAPSGFTGVACSDDAKGSLLLSFVQQGPQGMVPTITVRDGPTPGPAPATEVPLNVYVADGTEPWLQYNLPKGIYRGTILFRKDGWPDVIVREWEENWS